jgi:hypothetical protein
MEPEGSLPFPTGPTNCPCPEPDECSPQLFILYFDTDFVYQENDKNITPQKEIPDQ